MPEYDLTFLVVAAVVFGPVLLASLFGKGARDE
jgi:hypothetical protein